MSSRRQKRSQLGFFFYAFHVWAIFGLLISNAFLALSILTLPSAPNRWRRAFGRWNLNLWLPLSLYALFLVISIGLSVEPSASRPEIKELFNLCTLPLAFAWVRSERSVRRVLEGLVMVVAGTAVWGLSQFLAGYGELAQRIRGPFSHYMTFSGVLLLADLLLVADLACRSDARRPWKWVALVVINAAIVGTLTRSAWVALLVSLLVLAFMHAPKSILVLVPALALGLFLAPSAVQQRFVSIFDVQDVTNYDRLCMAEAGLKMVQERPFFGLGPETVKERYPIYRQPTAPRRSVSHLHNTFVNLAAERGLTSLAAYLWLVGGAMILAFRSYRDGKRERGYATAAHLGAFLALLAFNIAGLFEANWRDTELQRLALLLTATPYLLESLKVGANQAPVRE